MSLEQLRKGQQQLREVQNSGGNGGWWMVIPPLPSQSLTSPLKNDGWKTTFLLGR